MIQKTALYPESRSLHLLATDKSTSFQPERGFYDIFRVLGTFLVFLIAVWYLYQLLYWQP